MRHAPFWWRFRSAQQELNALVWCDHTDPELIRPFEEAHDVRVNLKEYEGTGTALSIIEQSQPGDWDVLVVDGIDVPRVVEAGSWASCRTRSCRTRSSRRWRSTSSR